MTDPRLHQIETWLYAYPAWQRRLKSLRTQLDNYPRLRCAFRPAPSFVKGEVSDPTYDAVEKRMVIEEQQIRPLEFRIRLLENALSVLTGEEMAFVKLKYFEQKNNTIAWELLFLSRRTFFRQRVAVLGRLFEALGGEFALIWEEGDSHTRTASR